MDMMNLIGGQSAGAVKRWVPLRRISAFGSGNIVIPSTVPIGSRIRVTVQGPGGAGGVATTSGWPGSGGGSGGRARKIYTVNPGDSFPYVVGRGGQTAGAAGLSATTFSSGGTLISGGPGSGGGPTTAANQLGGAGGVASGGDENQNGAVGGGSAASNYIYAPGGSGAGAPMTGLAGLVAGTPGRISNTITFQTGWTLDETSSGLGGVHQGGGRGAMVYSSSYFSINAGPGKLGGGGGGSHAYTSVSGGVANTFRPGGNGYILIEIEASLPAPQQLFERDNPNTAAIYPANALLPGLPEADINFSNPGTVYPYRHGLAVTPIIMYAGALVNEISFSVGGGVWRGGRISIYSIDRCLIYTGLIGGAGGGNGWYTMTIPSGLYLEKGFYFLTFSGGNADFYTNPNNTGTSSQPSLYGYNFTESKGGNATVTRYPDIMKMNMPITYDGNPTSPLNNFASIPVSYNVSDLTDCNFFESAPDELPPLSQIGGYTMPVPVLRFNG